jgi:hypothetical protein
MRTFWITSLLLLVVADSARGQSIGIYADPQCTECATRIERGETRFLFVCADTGFEASGPRIVAGSFRITGLPAEWFVFSGPAPALRSWNGDPITTGTRFHLQEPSGGVFQVMLVMMTATTEVRDLALGVEAPIFGPLTTPSLAYESLEVEQVAGGRSLFLNGDGSCNVAIATPTWSQVRLLFRD